MKVMAHRGYSGQYPENTMLSFRKAAEVGTDGIELDVHMTHDGVLVVHHDERVDRTTDGIGRICDLSFKELRCFNAAKLWSNQYAPEKVPAFEEYCEWASSQSLFTNIEVKTDNTYYPDIEQKIWNMVVRYGLEDRVLFSSFNHFSLTRMKQFLPENVELGALVEHESGVKVYPGLYCKQAGFHCYHPPIAALTEENVANCKAHGIKINVWTVNDMAGLEKLYAWDIDGIITNYPGVPMAWLAAQSR